MKIIDPGHQYALDQLDSVDPDLFQQLIFVKREGPGYPGNKGHHSGTNIQEVLRALIDRVKYLDDQVRDRRNGALLELLRMGIYLLEERAADRHMRNWALKLNLENIENLSTCSKCKHIGCEGQCHP